MQLLYDVNKYASFKLLPEIWTPSWRPNSIECNINRTTKQIDAKNPVQMQK